MNITRHGIDPEKKQNGKHILVLNSFIIDKNKQAIKLPTILSVSFRHLCIRHTHLNFFLTTFSDTSRIFLLFSGVALCIERRKP